MPALITKQDVVMQNSLTNSASSRQLAHALYQMTWPMLFGVLSLMSFQLVDSAFIGQLGVLPLAAQGFTGPMQLLIIGIQVGLGIATTAIVSRTLGAGDDNRARRLGGLVIVLGGVLISLLCLAIWWNRALILTLLGADETVHPLIDQYWVPWLLSAWTGAMLYFGYSICRSHGNTLLPGSVMVFTSLLNIALDPLYIFVFDWGLPGAGWATLTCFGLGCLIVFPQIRRRHWLASPWHELALGPAVRQISSIMGPAMLSQLMPPLAAIAATALVASYGSAAIGAWGMGARLDFFSLVVVLALTMSLPPMVGRLLGAGHYAAIARLVKLAIQFVMVWQLAIAVVWFVSAAPLSQLLSSSDDVAEIINRYLQWLPVSYGALGVCMVLVSVCNALGHAMRALAISSARLFACYLPLLWLGAWLGDLPGLFSGAMLGNLAAGAMAWFFYRRGMKQLRHENPGMEQ